MNPRRGRGLRVKIGIMDLVQQLPAGPGETPRRPSAGQSSSALEFGFCWEFAGCEPEAGLARLREYGFDGIELWPRYLEEWGVARWKTALDAIGMCCVQLCPYFDFVSGEAKLAASRRMLDEYLGAAALLGCRRLRVFTGPPWGEGVIGAREATPGQWESAIGRLREYCDLAGTAVELCLECHEGSLMEDSPSTLRLLEAVGRPNLTVNLQLPLRDEESCVSLRELGRFTRHIHIHNWETALGEGPLTFLDAGAFDWRPVIASVIASNGSDLCLSVEHPSHGGRDDPWETARRDGAFLQRLRA